MTWQALAGVGAWSGIDWTGAAVASGQTDPYLAWADVSGFADLGGEPAGWMRVIIELEKKAPDGSTLSAQSFAESLEGANAAWKDWIQVPSVYRFPPPRLKTTRFLTAVVMQPFFVELATSLQGIVKRFELGMPVVPDDASQAAAAATTLAPGTGPVFGAIPATTAPAGGKRGKPHAVFMGVMDDGLAFAHERFRAIDGSPSTRIEYFWDQGEADTGPLTLNYGSELSKADIDALLLQSSDGGLIDEDGVYLRAGYIVARKRWAHGTEVMDLACGVRPNRIDSASVDLRGDSTATVLSLRVLCVQFRTAGRTVRDTSGRWFAVHALDAMRYLLRRAHDLADNAGYSVVLNLSYGYMAGPHDGSSIIEAAMDELITKHRNLSLVLPAGNSNLARCHGEIVLAAGASQPYTWRVLPDCATPSFLEIWLPPHVDASSVTVKIRPPWNESSPEIAGKSVYSWQPGRTVLCSAIYLERVATGDRTMLLIALAPTLTHQASRDAAPAGNWIVTLTNRSGNELDIHAWVQRNETAYGYPLRGRQSRFEDLPYKRFVFGAHLRDFDDGNDATWIKRAGTLSSIATGRKTVVVGGYRLSDGRAATYSSTGPSLDLSKRSGPDATAVTEDSVVFGGVLAASTRSGCLLAVSGTSAAAPQVARMLAKQKIFEYAGGIPPAVTPTTPIQTARAWVDAQANALDPESATIQPHELAACSATVMPAILPIGQHAYLPRLPEIRGGYGRLPEPRGRKRGIKP